MDKKETLHGFQARLADRLQTASASSDAANWLGVEVAGKGFLFPLGQSGEIFPWVDPHPVPYTKDWFLGVVNLRGVLCGVASLAKFLTIEASTPQSKAYLHDKRLIGFHPSAELNTVLVVDRLAGLKTHDQMTAVSTEGLFSDEHGVEWQEINLQLLSQNPNFVSIARPV
jgi:twitching motility protein PilI